MQGRWVTYVIVVGGRGVLAREALHERHAIVVRIALARLTRARRCRLGHPLREHCCEFLHCVALVALQFLSCEHGSCKRKMFALNNRWMLWMLDRHVRWRWRVLCGQRGLFYGFWCLRPPTARLSIIFPSDKTNETTNVTNNTFWEIITNTNHSLLQDIMEFFKNSMITSFW